MPTATTRTAQMGARPSLLKPPVLDKQVAPLSLYEAGLLEHRRLFDLMVGLRPEVEASAQAMGRCLMQGGKIMFCGNGGSASDSLHLAAELTGRFMGNRRPLPALALCADAAAMTCIGNDFGFEHVFERQVNALGRPGDCLVCISTSGSSRNVLLAAKAAADGGVTSIALAGQSGPLLECCDFGVAVPGSATARIQEAHIFIGHVWCTLIERHLGLS